MYTLSIIVPAYNVEKYLNKNLSSFNDERFNNQLEVLIVNDGSTDSTVNIAQEFVEKNPFIFKLINKQNGGPLKNFSSGMAARLGFAIATTVKPDILICDEVLAVGDFKFQEKCEKRMNELLSGGTTLLFVSHSTEQVKRMCQKAIWIDHGEMRMIGDAAEVCDAYTRM